VLAGSKDIVRPAHTRMIHRLIAGSRLRIVSGGTHTMIKDLPDVVGPIMIEFLDDAGG